MNRLLIDVLKAVDPDNYTTTLKVIDYVLCTTSVTEGEEVEVLKLLVYITKLLELDWHPVFDVGVVSLASDGKAPGRDGVPIDKPIPTLLKVLCGKRATLYREKEPSISGIGDSIRSSLLSTTPQGD